MIPSFSQIFLRAFSSQIFQRQYRPLIFHHDVFKSFSSIGTGRVNSHWMFPIDIKMKSYTYVFICTCACKRLIFIV